MSWKERMKGSLQGVRSVTEAVEVSQRQTLPIDALRPGIGQPRRHFDDQRMDALVASVREHGILQPIVVRPVERAYEIVAGERRWKAAQRVGLAEVPVYVRTLSDDAARAASLTENLVREDLTPFDEIQGRLILVQVLLGTDDEAATILRLNQLEKAVHPSADEQTQIEALEQLFAQLGGEKWTSYTKAKLAVFGWHPEIVTAMQEGLEFTKAKLIQSAPEGLRSELLVLAQRGVSRSELQKKLASARKRSAPARTPYARAAQALSNSRKLAQLSPAKAEEAQELVMRLLDLLGEK